MSKKFEIPNVSTPDSFQQSVKVPFVLLYDHTNYEFGGWHRKALNQSEAAMMETLGSWRLDQMSCEVVQVKVLLPSFDEMMYAIETQGCRRKLEHPEPLRARFFVEEPGVADA